MNVLLKLIIYLNIIEVIDAMAVVLFTFLISSQPLHILPIISSMLLTFFLYSLNRVADINEDKINFPERIKFWERYGKKLILIGSIFFIITIIINSFHNVLSTILIIFPFLCVFSYSFFRLKNILLIKNLVVALGWAVIPLFASTYMSSPNLLLITVCSIIVFFAVLINTIIFDIKDIKGDRISGVRTIPSIYGISFTKKLGIFLDIMLFLVIIFFIIFKVLSEKFLLFSLLVLFIIFYILAIDEKNALFISEYIANLDMLVILFLGLIMKII
ncbi:MAG: UbiA family prenyltransferase [Candidatus Aenigmatarchaeota archaeon]